MGNQLLAINVAKRPDMAPPKLDGVGMWLTAWDPVNQKEVWRAKDGTAGSGTMTTAGNLVFQGHAAAQLHGVRADTGEKVWSADSGASIAPGSITYELGGTQYIAVGGRRRGRGDGQSRARLQTWRERYAAAHGGAGAPGAQLRRPSSVRPSSWRSAKRIHTELHHLPRGWARHGRFPGPAILRIQFTPKGASSPWCSAAR